MANILLGIDDTDNKDSPGTGQLVRRLSAEIERLGGKHLGTTRHQFLVDPRIPYTGHNRGICIAIDWEGPMTDLNFVFDLVTAWSADGSDPGVCIAAAEAVPPSITRWGERAMREVLIMEDATALARESGLNLRPLGGTGQGIIGALASVGLRAGGEIGRFVDMSGLRSLGEVVSAEKLHAMGIRIDHKIPGENPHTTAQSDAIYKTLGWVRPRLSGGQPVLAVEWSDHDHAWIPVDRKTIHEVEPGGH